MASDSTSIDELPGGNNVEQQNRVVLEKTEMQGGGNSNQQVSYSYRPNFHRIQLIKLYLVFNKPHLLV